MKTTKLVVSAIALIIGIIAACFGLFLTYLMLIHIEGTELMWFVFWLYVPMTIILTLLAKIVDALSD